MSRWKSDELDEDERSKRYQRLPELLKQLGELVLLEKILPLPIEERADAIRPYLAQAVGYRLAASAVQQLTCLMKAYEDVSSKKVIYLCEIHGSVAEAMAKARAKGAIEFLQCLPKDLENDYEFRQTMAEPIKLATHEVLIAWRQLGRKPDEAQRLLRSLTDFRPFLRDCLADLVRTLTDSQCSVEIMLRATGHLASVPTLFRSTNSPDKAEIQMAIGAVHAMDAKDLRVMAGLGVMVRGKSGLVAELTLQMVRKRTDLDEELVCRVNDDAEIIFGVKPTWFGPSMFDNVLVMHLVNPARITESMRVKMQERLNVIIHETLAPFGELLHESYGLVLIDGRTGKKLFVAKN